MTQPFRRSFFTSVCLIAAVAMPVLYFGAQLAAAPFFPGYSFARDSASMLGTAFSLRPSIFNVGAIVTGISALAGGVGLYRAFCSTTNSALAGLIALSVVATGVMSLKAGLFPMPDERHASWGFLTAFTIATPFLFVLGLWKRRDVTGLRLYLLASIALVLLLIACMSGMISAIHLLPGVFQRLLAFATFVPVGVVAYFFKRRLSKSAINP